MRRPHPGPCRIPKRTKNKKDENAWFRCGSGHAVATIRRWAEAQTKDWDWWKYARCMLIPFAVFLWGHNLLNIYLPTKEQPPATQEEVVQMMRTLQGYVLN